MNWQRVDTQAATFDRDDGDRAIINTCEDLILVVSYFSSLNAQVAQIRVLLVFLVAIVGAIGAELVVRI